MTTKPDRSTRRLATIADMSSSTLWTRLRPLITQDGWVRVGVLAKRVDGRRSYIKANEDSPIFPELRGMIEKTGGIVPMLRKAIAGTKGLKIGFVYKSLARGEEGSGSDVDVIIL